METTVKTAQKRQKLPKILGFSALGLIVILALVLLGANMFAKRSLPQISGEIQLEGLLDKVTVVRDEKGVPHIEAQNDHDLYMAQGYVTAQDRLFQMDLSRRQASGQLSEVIGDKAIDKDKFFRTFGLRRAAEISYPDYNQETKDILKWYAEGVNSFMRESINEKKLPVEFTLLGYKPSEWTPIDSLTIAKYMAYDLGGHWQGQAFRSYVLTNFGEEKAYDLFPNYPKDAPYVIPKGEIDYEKSFANAIIPPEFNGSNNWVISGEKSETGAPLLADDPHLGLATPSVWYQTTLKSPEQNVSGVIFGGLPGIILGHNENIAWGITNVGPDVQDLYIEKRNPDNPNQFLYNGKYEDAKIITETINVKDQDPIDYKVTVTRHGPVISEFAHQSEEDTVLAMKWTALEATQDLEALKGMNTAKNWEEFDKAIEPFKAPSSNFVFAAKDGTIAYKASGNIPIRKKGESLVPVPGWNDEYEWEGYIPHDQLPTLINPKDGFIATANNKIVDETYPYHISNTWAQPYRQKRILEVLNSKDKFSVQDMQDLQMDIKNLQAEEFVPMFLERLAEQDLSKKEKEAIEILKKWNYEDEKNATAPLLFQQLYIEISDILFGDVFSEDIMTIFEGRAQIIDELIRRANEGNEGPWVKENGGLSEVIHKALQQSVKNLEKKHGEDMNKWSWGSEHQLKFMHPLSSVNPLQYIFNDKEAIPVGGSKVTVQAAERNIETGLVNHGASWRYVIDVSDLMKGYHIVGPGQAGHFKSKWYDDQVEDWANGEYHETNLNYKGEENQSLTLSPK